MLIKVTQFLQQPNAKLKHLSEQGFTLVESLMAMVVISIVVVAMTPPIFLSVATRVQHRRAEQAMQVAQGEMDRVRVLVEQGNYELTELPDFIDNLPPATSGNDTPDSRFEKVPPPTSLPGNNLKSDNSTCPAPYTVKQIPENRAWRVDIDRDCKMDFLVQIFRDRGDVDQPNATTVRPIAFRMGVRVYAAMAESNLASLVNPPLPAPLNFTTGLGNQRTRPLAVIYNKIARSDAPSSLSKYKNSLPP